MLFGHPPNYDHMRVFSCLAFAATPRKESNKFKARGLPCVFLGYFATQKGYKLLDLHSNKMFVSRDVKFEEHIFPFHKDSSVAYMKPTPINMVPRVYAYGLYITASQMPNRIEPNDLSHSENDAPACIVVDASNIDHGPAAADNDAHDPNPRPSRPVKRPAWLTDYVTVAVKDSNKVFYPTANQVPYTHLSGKHQAFLTALDTQADPNSFEEAVKSQI